MIDRIVANGREAVTAVTAARIAEGTLGEIERAVNEMVEGSVRVLDAQATREWDREGDEQVRLVVTLADPAEDTWPSRDMSALSQRVRQLDLDRDLDLAVTYTNPTSDVENEPRQDDGSAGA